MRAVLLLVLAVGVVEASRMSGTPAVVTLIPVEGEGANYWPRWRGPSGQGHVTGTNYTDTWSGQDRVKWRTTVSGVGHSSPIAWADRLFLSTATETGDRVSMLAFRRSDGVRLWETVVPSTGIEHVYWKNSRASATPATDGTLIYGSFGTHGVAAFDFSGKLVWHVKLGDLANYHGSAGSPVLYKDRVFLFQDHDGSGGLGSFVAAFEKSTGRVIWRQARTQRVGWGTPIVIRVDDHDELVVSSQSAVQAYNPDTGEPLWTVRGNTREVIPTPVVGHGLVFASSGRAGPTFAITPGGRGDVTATHVAWTSPRGSPFVPSGMVHGDLLYLVNDMQSILTVFEAKTGTLVYQDRLGQAQREGFSASPVAVGDRIFFTNDEGQTFVVKAGRTFELLRVNEMGARVLASPALVDGTWYWRTAKELLAIR